MGTFIKHIPCGNCGSSDGRGVYADGTSWCFVCESFEGSHDEAFEPRKYNVDLLTGSVSAIPRRGLRDDTCQKFGYMVGTDCQIAPYHDASGRVVAQKIRKKDKQFSWVGDRKDALPFFGQHLWRDGGNTVTITEGEIDALSMAQAFNLSWPVVSLPDGAQSAKRAIKQ